ncbi:hypothetical protein RGQ29_019806 [Quercus rubra]|uniref:S-adenosylmethionine-dependent methyltransferase n=1 Tax=Quercus rubra TaxID=3512 RepID=A0AAN7FCZ0_QUERU|nr:hypothetical protein RGQ29_019806 [Quercus rubra]
MNRGLGPNRYAQNSYFQRGVVEVAKEKINEAVANWSLNAICVADLGCSTGPNTFVSVQNIIEAIELKYISKGENIETPKFMVFFNDQLSNDFNTLFISLPPNRQYFAAGVMGSFYGHLFPKASLHFIHSSYAQQWLSNVPKKLWMNGATQFAKDMESFLIAIAQELVIGGLLALFIPAVPDNISKSDIFGGSELDLLGSCLMDMAEVGLTSEAKVDAFNLLGYFTSPKELKALIERNQHFNIERMEILNRVIAKHFANDIMDELFNHYIVKVAEFSFFLNPKADKSIVLFDLLKNNT